MMDITILRNICKLKGFTCYHFDEDCVTCMKRKGLIKSKNDPLEILELLTDIGNEIEFERYYNRKITRGSVIEFYRSKPS